MATKGRKPANPKVKDLHAGANVRVVGGTDAGDQPPPEPPLEAPDWIEDPRARALWADLLPELKLRKQWLPLFSVELGRYCVAFGHYVEALEEMKAMREAGKGSLVTKTVKGNEIFSMWFNAATKAHSIMLALAPDLGLNAVAQVRLDGAQLDLFSQAGGGGSPDGGGQEQQNRAGDFSQFRRPQ